MKLEQALRDASVEVKRSTQGVVPDQPPTEEHRRSTVGPTLLALVVVIAGVGGFVALRGLDGSTSVDTDAAATTEEAKPNNPTQNPTEDGDGSGMVVTEAAPEDLTLHYAGPTSDLGPTTGTTRFTVYGLADRAPIPGDDRLKILEATGATARPPVLPPGEDLDVNGRLGRLMAGPEPVVMFEHDDTLVQLYSGTLSADELIAAANSLTFDANGLVEPLVDPPGELTLLGSYERHYHDDANIGVSTDADVTVYRAGSARYLDITSTPLVESDRNLHLWGGPVGSETATIGGREVQVIEQHNEYGSRFVRLQWFEGSSLLEVAAFGLTDEEVAEAMTGLQSSGEPVEIAQPEAVPVTPDVPVPAAGADASNRLIPSVIPEGLTIVASADFADLGAPGFSDVRYVYGPADVTLPGPTDPVLSLSVAQAPPGLFYGEPIKIGGFDAVIVDKEAAGTPIDVQMIAGGQSFEFRGVANLTTDEIIAAAKVYAGWVTGTAGDVGPLDTVGVDLHLRLRTEYVGWMDSGIGGVPDSSLAILADSSGSTMLQVASWAGDPSEVDLYRWVHPDTAVSLEVGGRDAALSEPMDGIYVLRLATDDRVIEMQSVGLSEEELLAAATSLRPATDDEWNIGLP